MATHPLPGSVVTAGFGPYPHLPGRHYGIDFGGPNQLGRPIVANRAGRVLRAGWDETGFGWHVRILSGDLECIYGHMRRQPLVRDGQNVAEGATIGEVGQSGNATGPHLHFEVRKGGTTRDCAVNPAPYLVNPPKPKPAPAADPVLRRGSKGAAVKALQVGLLRTFPAYADQIKENGGPIPFYGAATEATVREFQHRTGLPVSGVVDARTWRELSKYGVRSA